MLVADGTVYGRSYQGMGGMLAVSGGRAQVRWLRDQPLQPGEQFEQAVQGWPMLLGSAGQPAYTETDEAVAARTAVGQDRAGRLILLVCPNSFFTLHGLTEWLAGSDLDLDTAFNLDGGPSTGLWIDPAAGAVQLDSFGAVPAVILLRR